MVFNTRKDYQWSAEFEGCPWYAFDVENAAAHEFGHWVGLGDVYDNWEATMYYETSPGETEKRTLSGDDIEGIRHIYGSPPPPPCPWWGCCHKTPPTNSVDHPSEGGGCGNFERGRVNRDEELWLSLLGLDGVFEGVEVESLGVDFDWEILRLYWENKCEVLGLLWGDSSLLGRTVDLVQRYRLEIRDVVCGGDGRRLGVGDIEAVDSLLGMFYEKGSPGLRDAVRKVRVALGACEGRTVREVLSMDLGEVMEESSVGVVVPTFWELVVFPNPSVGSVGVRCGLPERSWVRVSIYDVGGRSVGSVVDGEFDAGRYSWGFEGKLSVGLYFVRMEAGGHVGMRKLVVLGE